MKKLDVGCTIQKVHNLSNINNTIFSTGSIICTLIQGYI